MIVALGGDGLMLQTLHRMMDRPKPIYGMNFGSVGFLMNEYSELDLPERLAAARPSILHPLAMEAIDVKGHKTFARAINEVSLLRQTSQAAKMTLSVDGAVRLAELIADGVLVSTPGGLDRLQSVGQRPDRAARRAADDADADLRASARGAGAARCCRITARVAIEILEADKRPVAATADHFEIRRVARVEIATDHDTTLVLLHDPGHSLDERILREQFGY